MTRTAKAAAALGMTEGAVRVAVHRMRRRFRDVLRSQITETVAADEIDEEISFSSERSVVGPASHSGVLPASSILFDTATKRLPRTDLEFDSTVFSSRARRAWSTLHVSGTGTGKV